MVQHAGAVQTDVACNLNDLNLGETAMEVLFSLRLSIAIHHAY